MQYFEYFAVHFVELNKVIKWTFVSSYMLMLTSESAITDTNIGQVFRKTERNAEHGGEGRRDITVPGGVALRSQGRHMETAI